MLLASSVVVIIMVCPHQIFGYNTNRQVVLVKPNCDYYENPVFEATPVFIQNRIGEMEPTQQVVLVDNRLRKENPYYTYQNPSIATMADKVPRENPYYSYQNPSIRTPTDKIADKVPRENPYYSYQNPTIKTPIEKVPIKETPYYHNQRNPSGQTDKSQEPRMPVTFFPNMSPASAADLKDVVGIESREEDEEEGEGDYKVDYDKLWKVGEIPATRGVKALPDIYVKPEDAPPIVDMLSVERSELTEETHDMEDVEIEEKLLSDPKSETEEVIIERVSKRPEPPSTVNPAIAMFKQIDVMQKINENKDVGKEKEIMDITATMDTNKKEKKVQQKNKVDTLLTNPQSGGSGSKSEAAADSV